MSHTNSTTNYGLPQFLTGDKPAWLTDINNAFSDIDTAVNNAQTKADTAFTDAGNAQTDATTAINNAAAADAKGSGALASIESVFDPTTIYSVGAKVIYNSLLYRCTVAVTTPGPWTGSNNWERITVDSLIATTDSKIGNITSLSTNDKTSLVNAVNEVNGKVNCASIVQTRLRSDYTLTSTSPTKVFDDGTAYLSEGDYIFEVTFPAIWTIASGVINGGLRVDNTYFESDMIYGPKDIVGLITFKGSVHISSAGNHTIGSAIRTDAEKPVTIKSYVSPTVTLWRC